MAWPVIRTRKREEPTVECEVFPPNLRKVLKHFETLRSNDPLSERSIMSSHASLTPTSAECRETWVNRACARPNSDCQKRKICFTSNDCTVITLYKPMNWCWCQAATDSSCFWTSNGTRPPQLLSSPLLIQGSDMRPRLNLIPTREGLWNAQMRMRELRERGGGWVVRVRHVDTWRVI